MSTRPDLETLTRDARACVTAPARSTVRGQDVGTIRWELFHSGMSLCSQKVRALLAEKNATYRSHDLVIVTEADEHGNVTPAENYHPSFVRLRMEGGRSSGLSLVDGYGGQSDVRSQGFDPCVVPLLVDHELRRVVVDSAQICRYIDEHIDGSKLIPASEPATTLLTRHLQLVDATPHPSLLYGFHPDDRRPTGLREVMSSIYDAKIAALEQLIVDNAADPDLLIAYRAKIKKEAGGKAVSRDRAFQEAARVAAQQAVEHLASDLRSGGGPWLLGANFSLADLVWGVSLLRMKYLGLASLWVDAPEIELYVERLTLRESLRSEALQATSDSMPPSDYMSAPQVASEC